MIAAVFVSCLLATSLAGVVPNGDCDTAKLATCGNTFLKALGITSKLSGVQFIEYTQKLIYDKGVSGIEQTCMASANLLKCVGAQAAACFTEKNLQTAFQITQEDSVQYTYQLTGMKYTCIDNPAPFQKQIQCIATVSHDKFGDLNACTQTFFSNIAKDPQNVCKYMEAYKTCSVPFYSDCGADLQKALCTGMATQASAVYPGCTWSCTSGWTSLAAAASCDTTKMASCAAAFEQTLGITSKLSGKEFVEYIYKYVADNGVNGIKTTCAATSGLNTCLGSMMNACFNIADIMTALGVTQEDATIIMFQLTGMEYSCVDNPAPFLKQISCIADVSKSKYNTLLQCASTLYNSISSDPANSCKYLGTFKDCTVGNYASCGSDLQSALCSGIQAQAKSVVSGCSISC